MIYTKHFYLLYVFFKTQICVLKNTKNAKLLCSYSTDFINKYKDLKNSFIQQD